MIVKQIKNAKVFLILFGLVILFIVAFGTPYLVKQRQEIREEAAVLTEKFLFSDNFEVPISADNWQFRGLVSSFEIDSSISSFGSSSLKIHNNGEPIDSDGGGLQSITHNFIPIQNTGTVKVSFYDYGDNRSAGSVFSISNSDVSKYLIIQVNEDEEIYDYRIQDQHLDSEVPRTEGWHILEFIVTPWGSYGKIDGHPLSDLGIHFELKEIARVNLGRGWSKQGDTYFDNLQVKTLFAVPSSQQEILDSWSDKVYEIYKDTDLSGITDEIKTESRNHENTGRARVLAGQAMMHAYYFSRDGNPDDLEKARKYIKTVIETYDKWKQAWLSQITTNQLAFDVWWLWDYLDTGTKADFFNLMTEEANFWSWVLEEVKERPWQKTLPREIRSDDCYNIEVITATSSNGKGDPNRYLIDTKAEETTAVAQLLATAYSMFPSASEAEEWNQAAKCYAFHTLNTGEKKCGIAGRTITDNFEVANHGYFPNHDYAFAGITGLLQGELSYAIAGKIIPDEFHHNIEEKTNSEFWQNNIQACRVGNSFRTSCDCVIAKTNPWKCEDGEIYDKNTFLTHPKGIRDGFVKATTSVQLPDSERITLKGKLGIPFEKEKSNGVRVKISIKDANNGDSDLDIFDKVVTYDNKIDNISVDLTPYKGINLPIIFTVSANGSPDYDNLGWIDLKIEYENEEGGVSEINLAERAPNFYWENNDKQLPWGATSSPSDGRAHYSSSKDSCEQEEKIGWKNKDLKLGLFNIPYWAKIDNDSNSVQLFNEMFTYFYYIRKDLINDAYPFNTKITSIDHYNGFPPSESFYWWKNIERYVQTSAKFYVLDHYRDPLFRQRFFPLLAPKPSVILTPTSLPTSIPTPALTPTPTSIPATSFRCDSHCSWGEWQCGRDNAGKTGGSCQINPACSGVPDDNYQSYWRWSYCYPILTPTTTPINTPILTSSPPDPFVTPILTLSPEDKIDDLNNDGNVDVLDYGILVAHLGEKGTPGEVVGDLNNDGVVDELDYGIFIAHF